MSTFVKRLQHGLFLLFGVGLFGASSLQAQFYSVGGFESNLPSYWTKGAEPAGSTLTWATDQAHTLARSLKITKAVTSEAAAWVSENVVDYWSPQHLANVDIKIGAWIKTQNVNTNPANDDARWWISYKFWDQAGQVIGETKLPINQSVATSVGFVADTNAVGETILPRDAWKTVISFIGGKNATGTVWADDFIHVGRKGAWAGQNWNQTVDMPTGWLYWFPPIGGNDGVITKGFENTGLTSEETHSGLYSMKFDLPFNRQPNDGFIGTKRFLLAGSGGAPNPAPAGAPFDITSLKDVKAGDVLRISVWVKAKNLVPDSAKAYPVTWAAGFTYGFFKGNGNNDGFNNVTGYPIDTQFTFPAVTQFDWTEYTLDFVVPNDPDAKALEVRLHPYARFTGTVYFDDLNVKVVGTTAVKDRNKNLGVPETFELAQNYPNPFNPSTRIAFGLPRPGNVTVDIFNMAGQKVATLFDGFQAAGRFEVTWNGKDSRGNAVGSGIYFYRLHVGDMSLTKRMLFVK